MPIRSLDGRTAIVTGASRGLGKAIAISLARSGASVVVASRTESIWDDRQPGTIGETVQEIERLGGRAIAVPTDVANEADLEQLVATSKKHFGAADILVNNAAVTIGGRPSTLAKSPSVEAPIPRSTAIKFEKPISALDFPLKSLKLHFAVNVFAAYRLMQLVLPGMVDRKRGSIVNVSSNAAFKPGPGPYAKTARPPLIGYGVTKIALHSLTQAVAVEFASHGIAANVLIPSMPILTPGTASLTSSYTLDKCSTPESFADAAAILAGFTSYDCTGQILFHEDVNHPELGRRGYLGSELEKLEPESLK